MWSIFEPSLETVRDLIVDQVQSARLKDIVVKSIVVLGGFGDSPALREYLRIWLNEYNHDNGLVIEMKFALAYVLHWKQACRVGAIIANSYS